MACCETWLLICLPLPLRLSTLFGIARAGEGKEKRQLVAAGLQAVHTIHEARIVHSDLKPANFLMVEGALKLIDFGIAKAIQSDTTSIARESQVGTLNYMSPEAILGGANNIRGGPPMKVSRASTAWQTRTTQLPAHDVEQPSGGRAAVGSRTGTRGRKLAGMP